MSLVDELGRSLDSRVDGLFGELNLKIDCIAKQIRDKPSNGKSEDFAPFDLHEGAAESGIWDILVPGDDWLTYVTHVTEVHSGVFVDEDCRAKTQSTSSPAHCRG